MDGGGGHRVDSDRISSLPDDLLHIILIHLRSAPAAARTSLLSRRWRRVWAHLPELLLEKPVLPSIVHAALAACAAPTLSRLVIHVPSALDAAHVAPWLRFASQRLAGELSLHLPRTDGMLELPPCERVTTIDFDFTISLGLPRYGAFAALTVVMIYGARMEGRDMEVFGSSRCPRLQKLTLLGVTLVTASDVSIRSESLEKLVFLVHNTKATGVTRLEVVAPRLQRLRAPALGLRPDQLIKGYVVAPKLADFAWFGAYDPQHHRFVGAGRHLRQLLLLKLPMAALMQRFDTVDELVLKFGIHPGSQGYESFLKATRKLAKCEALDVYLSLEWHALAPSVLHLLRKSSGLRKLVVRLPRIRMWGKGDICTSAGCPCCLPESYRIDNIALDSLEEVAIVDFSGEDHQVQFLNLLLGCNAPNLKNVDINLLEHTPLVLVSMETCQKIRRAARLNTDVKFNVWSDGRWVPYTL